MLLSLRALLLFSASRRMLKEQSHQRMSLKESVQQGECIFVWLLTHENGSKSIQCYFKITMTNKCSLSA